MTTAPWRPAAAAVAARWEALTGPVRSALDDRARTLLAALGAPVTDDLAGAVEQALAGAGAAELWLAVTVLTGRFPAPADVAAATRRGATDGALSALVSAGLGDLLAGRAARNAGGELPGVEVIEGAVLVDVNETGQAAFHTGIQRVVRETVRRWVGEHDVVLVGWDDTLPGLRRVSDEERRRAVSGRVAEPVQPVADVVAVPWRSSYVLPELIVDPRRTGALHALLRDSGNASLVVGHDCVPLTSTEFVGSWQMSEGFCANLAAVAHAQRVATTSGASTAEYAGWRRMLTGSGLPGPPLVLVPLPAQARAVSEDALARTRAQWITADLPMVLVVGSHEPRKNHLQLLHAAELLWRSGHAFSLVFAGGNAWSSEPFLQRVGDLAAAGCAVSTRRGAGDEELWAAYRLARFTVFPSLNEGYGLPVAESLAAGTPVITSRFGSMQEIAAGGGALLADPRDPEDLAAAMARLLTDDVLLAGLAAAARARPRRTWDDYAAELWAQVPR